MRGTQGESIRHRNRVKIEQETLFLPNDNMPSTSHLFLFSRDRSLFDSSKFADCCRVCQCDEAFDSLPSKLGGTLMLTPFYLFFLSRRRRQPSVGDRRHLSYRIFYAPLIPTSNKKQLTLCSAANANVPKSCGTSERQHLAFRVLPFHSIFSRTSSSRYRVYRVAVAACGIVVAFLRIGLYVVRPGGLIIPGRIHQR